VTDREARQGWNVGDQDRGLLIRIAQALRNLSPLAESGNDLIALGEAWNAIERVIDGETIDVNVEVTAGFRRGDREFSEGLFMDLRINEYEIVLDQLNTSYSLGVGGDHFTEKYATLSPGSRFDAHDVERWLEKLAEVLRLDGVKLSTELDHV
jgi:hypothetical protein